MPSPDLEKAVAETPAPKKFASREEWLGFAGKLKEAEVFVEGIGWLIAAELSGGARADIIGESATALNDGRLAIKEYQKSVLQHGIVDPASPLGARTPLFRAGDVDRVMQIGGKAIQKVVEEIERLSAMGRFSQEPEGNSEPTPSAAPTS